MSRRITVALLVFGVLIIYGLVIADVARAEYSLIDDYRAFTLIHIGAVRATLLKTLVDWRAPDAWLYRPFPDTISYALAAILRHHSGAWRVLLIVVRLVCVVIVFRIARAGGPTIGAACAATAYFAFFPAIPELHLLRVEGWLVLVLSIALLGMTDREAERLRPRRVRSYPAPFAYRPEPSSR